MSIQARSKLRRAQKAKELRVSLNLTALVDVFTTLVFFLLASAQNPVSLPSLKNIDIPRSIASDNIPTSLKMVVQKDHIIINDEVIMELHADPGDNDYTRLALALVKLRPSFPASPSANGVLDRDVVILGDQTVPFAVIRQIMRICGEQQFGRISFATRQEKPHE